MWRCLLAVQNHNASLGLALVSHIRYFDRMTRRSIRDKVSVSAGDDSVGQSRSRQRRSPGRPRVPLDRIVETALRVVDEEGAEALSMRTLAQRLQTGTATLYRAVANRTELIAHVVDRVFGEIEVDPELFQRDDWQPACLTAGQAAFDTLSRHRHVAPLLIEQVPTGPNAMIFREQLLALLLKNGFSQPAAARAYATLAHFVLGFAVQVRVHDATDADSERVRALYHELDPALFPATLRVSDVLTAETLEEEFRFGLALIVDGLGRLRDTT